jgi:superfamily I DNA/RNA helicase
MGLFDRFKRKAKNNIENTKVDQIQKGVEEPTLYEIICSHGPVRARQLITMLSNEYGLDVDKSELNSLLYAMKSKGVVQVDDEYRWTAADRDSKKRTKKAQRYAERVVPTPEPAIPEFEYTEEQQRIINLDPTGNLLVRGQAGSGKTTVLAARMGQVLAVTGKGSMLFLTYNGALSSYVRKAFKNANVNKDLKVMTYHEWSRTTAKELGYSFKGWASSKWSSHTIRTILEIQKEKNPEHRLLQFDKEPTLTNWWQEEIAWIFGYGVMSRSAYQQVERKGRGIAIKPTSSDRELIWTVFDEYTSRLANGGFEDYDNAGGMVINALNDSNGVIPESARYDHVFIDEVQDFHQTWLMALAPFSRISLSMAGDLAQKIYKRNFSWRSVGIDIHASRSKKLSGSHRTTKQIMEVAIHLTQDSDQASMEDYVEPVLPRKNGPRVNRIMREGVRKAYNEGYKYIADNLSRFRTTSVAVALPFVRQTYGAKKHLDRLKVRSEIVRGAKLGQVQGGISITTLHQLKGLEFDHVVILGLDDTNFPGKFLGYVAELDVADEDQSLKRLLYVAMTRAKESLTIVGSDDMCRYLEDVPEILFNDV